MKAICWFSSLLLLAACSSKTPKTPQSENNIVRVNFYADACFGTCPVFSMNIQENGKADYEAINHNELQGKFKTMIKKQQLDSLFMLIKKADIFTLKDKYEELVTDMPTYYLQVWFKDGKTKKIADYGPTGPEQLSNIYGMIFSLRGSQTWEKE